jgi:hypothetical protein
MGDMTPEAAWAAAMAYENRPDPYPFFDELRKTPVVHVGNGVCLCRHRPPGTPGTSPRPPDQLRLASLKGPEGRGGGQSVGVR